MAQHVPPHPFDVTLDDRGQTVVVRVQGEVDAATAPRVGETVMRQLAHHRKVILDLHDVDFMDLHGLGVIIRATRQARSDGGSFALARPAPCVRRLVELVHAENDIPVLPGGPEPRGAA